MTVPLHPPPDSSSQTNERRSLVEQYVQVRQATEALCRSLSVEDYVVQSMTEASPTKWHLAHTSWFFETFVLSQSGASYREFHPQFAYLFNSYYQTVGEMHSRPQRGLLSRPTVEEVFQYRAHVDENIKARLEADALDARLRWVLLLGLHHEQQHQELLITDVKHMLSCNPLRPAYHDPPNDPSTQPRSPMRWIEHEGGLQWIGHADEGFAYDNEGPQHRQFLNPFLLGSRPVTCGEYLEFMADGGYQRPELWLSEGWEAIQTRGWKAPLYWERRDGAWWMFTVDGMREVDSAQPVCHVSYYEADAFASWTGYRLPTEAEWEVMARSCSIEGNLMDAERHHPSIAEDADGFAQIYGDVWEWTQSPYSPYPGYRAPSGALGEYNGKFMCNQMVLRGGSCATPADHIRPTYRNFFHPAARWQFSGIRLARDL